MEIYAVDFDNTLCDNEYPNIGKPHLGIIEYFKNLQKRGDKLILWTCRSGVLLENAVVWCKQYGLEFDAVNSNLSEQIALYNNDPRKIGADHYCDDLSSDEWKKYL